MIGAARTRTPLCACGHDERPPCALPGIRADAAPCQPCPAALLESHPPLSQRPLMRFYATRISLRPTPARPQPPFVFLSDVRLAPRHALTGLGTTRSDRPAPLRPRRMYSPPRRVAASGHPRRIPGTARASGHPAHCPCRIRSLCGRLEDAAMPYSKTARATWATSPPILPRTLLIRSLCGAEAADPSAAAAHGLPGTGSLLGGDRL